MRYRFENYLLDADRRELWRGADIVAVALDIDAGSVLTEPGRPLELGREVSLGGSLHGYCVTPT